jgi:hypothetical protein
VEQPTRQLKTWIAAALLVVSFATGSVAAQEDAPAPVAPAKEPRDWHPLELIPVLALTEGFLVLNSSLLSKQPVAWGALYALMSPLGGSDNVNDAGNIAMCAAWASLGAYNVTVLSRDGYTDGERFDKNLQAHHTIVIFAALTFLTFGKPVAEKVSIRPGDDGLMLTFRSSF